MGLLAYIRCYTFTKTVPLGLDGTHLDQIITEINYNCNQSQWYQ